MRIRNLATLAIAVLACGHAQEAAAFTSSVVESREKTHAYSSPGDRTNMSPYAAEIHRLILTEIKRTHLPFGIASDFTFIVRFDLDRQGRVIGLALVQGSNLAEANDYAMQIIKRASRNFPPAPADTPGERIAFMIPIRMLGK